MLESLETLEVKVSEIYNLSNDTRSIKIKDSKQLAVTQSVERQKIQGI